MTIFRPYLYKNSPFMSRLAYQRLMLCSFLFLQSILSGCGYISLTRKTQFIPTTEDATVSIAPTEDGPFEEVTNLKTKIKLNHFKKSYWVKQEKLRHVSKTIEITRTSRNGLKMLDIALLIPTGIIATILTPVHFLAAPSAGITPSLGQTIALGAALGIGIGGWAAVIPAPGKLFPKTIDLPRLIPIITKDSTQLFLTAGEHEFRLKKSGVRVRDYPSMKQYDQGYGYESRDTAESFDFVEKLKLYDEVSDILTSAEYGIDSAKAKLNTTLKVDSWAHSIVFIATEDKVKCEVKVAWGLQTLDELQYLYDRSFSASSEWLPFREDMLDEDDQKMIITQALADAADESFKKFIALDTVQSILSSPVPIPLREEEELELTTGSVFAASVGDAVTAVITVVTNEGHGSGCIVTSDGYIVTNAHVVADDTTDLMAIMGEDVDIKIPLKFIRMNEAVDLALLKLDTTGLMPLKLAEEKDINTGADVYAIGTPADLELGQTVTRGIVSGKRKFGGHSVIQTDVAISAGNSGGAMISKDGLLLGIVTAEMRSRKVDDIGFALPAHIIESALKIKLTE